ncbi:MAG: endonuclease/exonuclease/phosphatase family protein [Bacteroidota bacterium]
MKKILLAILILYSNLSLIAQDLKIMTYNIRLDVASDHKNSWSNRKEFFCSQLNFYEPDIFGIQEALPNQVIDISLALPKYTNVGIGRDGIGKGESSTIYFKKDRFETLQENTFWLSETPKKVSKGWDAAYNRICTYVLLKDKISNKTFWVFNTHLDHLGNIAKNKSITLILSKIKQLNTNEFPVFLIGDFNSDSTDDHMLKLKLEMNDSYEISGQKPFGSIGTFNGFHHNRKPKQRLDYIFLSKNNFFKIKKYAVLTDSKDLRYPSDHFPVYIETIIE